MKSTEPDVSAMVRLQHVKSGVIREGITLTRIQSDGLLAPIIIQWNPVVDEKLHWQLTDGDHARDKYHRFALLERLLIEKSGDGEW